MSKTAQIITKILMNFRDFFDELKPIAAKMIERRQEIIIKIEIFPKLLRKTGKYP
jgi:hypothetical protein